jgi:hypothetical protein
MKRKHNAAPLGANEYEFQIGSEPPFEAFDTITTPEQEKRTLLAGKAAQEFTDAIPGGPVNSPEHFESPDNPKLGGNL